MSNQIVVGWVKILPRNLESGRKERERGERESEYGVNHGVADKPIIISYKLANKLRIISYIDIHVHGTLIFGQWQQCLYTYRDDLI